MVILHSYGKSQLLIGRSTINGGFSIANVKLPEGIYLVKFCETVSGTSLGNGKKMLS